MGGFGVLGSMRALRGSCLLPSHSQSDMCRAEDTNCIRWLPNVLETQLISDVD